MGLLRWALMMNELVAPEGERRRERVNRSGGSLDWETIKGWLRRLLP